MAKTQETMVEASGREVRMLTLPAVVGMSAVSKLSLRITGTQVSGFMAAGVALIARSISSAVDSAFGLTVISAFSFGPFVIGVIVLAYAARRAHVGLAADETTFGAV